MACRKHVPKCGDVGARIAGYFDCKLETLRPRAGVSERSRAVGRDGSPEVHAVSGNTPMICRTAPSRRIGRPRTLPAGSSRRAKLALTTAACWSRLPRSRPERIRTPSADRNPGPAEPPVDLSRGQPGRLQFGVGLFRSPRREDFGRKETRRTPPIRDRRAAISSQSTLPGLPSSSVAATQATTTGRSGSKPDRRDLRRRGYPAQAPRRIGELPQRRLARQSAGCESESEREGG